ncbi:MAG: alpha/beta hydrolase, partial [Mycobacterium sp.]
MMTRMPELSRRAVLRLGAGAAAGAAGVYALGPLLALRRQVAGPRLSMTGTGLPR